MQKELIVLPMTSRELSHELRTPLVPILGFAHELLETELTDKQKNYINDILAAGKQLEKLANRLTREVTRLAACKTMNDEGLQELMSFVNQHIQEKNNIQALKFPIFS